MALPKGTPKGSQAALVGGYFTRQWLRGPAWLDGDMVVMTCTSTYAPINEPTLGIELANVHTSDDAANFVTRFGLLRSSSGLGWKVETVKGLYRPEEKREPIADILSAATELRSIAQTAILVRKGAGGDEPSMDHLRSELQLADSLSDRSILLHASANVASMLSGGLASATPKVYLRGFADSAIQVVGMWSVGIEAETLLETCYLSLTLALSDEHPVEICGECGRLFVIEDPRQKFCTPACASRNRFKRFKESKATKVKTKKGGRDGKKTRTR